MITKKQFEDMVTESSRLQDDQYATLPFDKSKITTKDENGKLFSRASLGNSVWWVEIDAEAWKNNELKFVKK